MGTQIGLAHNLHGGFQLRRSNSSVFHGGDRGPLPHLEPAAGVILVAELWPPCGVGLRALRHFCADGRGPRITSNQPSGTCAIASQIQTSSVKTSNLEQAQFDLWRLHPYRLLHGTSPDMCHCGTLWSKTSPHFTPYANLSFLPLSSPSPPLLKCQAHSFNPLNPTQNPHDPKTHTTPKTLIHSPPQSTLTSLKNSDPEKKPEAKKTFKNSEPLTADPQNT